jgi:hypothetical protein
VGFSKRGNLRALDRAKLLMVAAFALALSSVQELSAVTLFQKSAFTTVDRKTCKIVRAHADGNAYLCPGLDGLAIYLAEGEGRTFVASGTAPEQSQAAHQSLGVFNTPFVKTTERATVEWRFTIKDKRRVPFAMIVRYFTVAEGRTGEVLVVTRIAGAEACQIAYVDALANPDAIVLARKIADERARRVRCSVPIVVEGERGQSPM